MRRKDFYILILYNNLEQEKINGLFLFEKIKNICDFTDGLIKYSDIKEKKKEYKTYKNYFRVIKYNGANTIREFPSQK